MGKKCVFFGLFLCGLLTATDSQAQQASPAATGAPALPSMKPTVPAHWIINYQQKQEAAPTPAPGQAAPGPGSRRLVKEDYQLDGQTAAVNRLYSDGTVQKTYVVKGIAFSTNPDNNRVRALMMTEGSGRDLRFGGSYPGFEWLKSDFFVDTPEQGGKKLVHYRQAPTKGKGGTTFDPYETRTDREAWIDADSHLPFAFRDGGLSGVYQFEPPSDQKIVLPPEIEKAIRFYNGYR